MSRGGPPGVSALRICLSGLLTLSRGTIEGMRLLRSLAERHVAEWALALVALIPIAALTRILATRVSYPMDLDWCEGGSLYMAYRVLHHLPVYVQPGDVFAPFPYPPAHTLALALAGWVAGGVDYTSGRLVSVVFFVVMCGAIAVEVRRGYSERTPGIAAAVAAVALIACAFPVTGGWYDLVRVDSMMLSCAVMAAVLVSEPAPGIGRILLSAAFMTVSVYTKQTAAFFAAWICLFVFFRHRRTGIGLTLATLAFCSTWLAVLNRATRGRFWFWIFGNLAAHPVHGAPVLHALQVVLRFAPFAAALPVAIGVLAWTGRIRPRTFLWLGMLVAAVPTALLPYAKDGGWLNDLIPIVVLVAPVTLLLAADLLRQREWWVPGVRFVMAAALGAFILIRPVSAQRFVPGPELREAAVKLNEYVGSLQGGVLMPQLAFTPARNGQTNPHWHRMGHADLEWSGRPLDEDWVVTRTQARYALLNWADTGAFGRAVRSRYRLIGNVPNDARVRMVTGGGIVNLDQVWERMPLPGEAP